MSNPNAAVAAVASALIAGVLWIVHKYTGVILSTYWSTLLVGLVTSALLFIGRDGVKGAFRRLWSGSKATWHGKPAKPSSDPDVNPL